MSTFCTEDPQFRSRDALYRPTSVYIGLNQCNQRCIDRRQPALLLLPAGRPSPLTPLRDLCKLHACTHLFICVRRRWTNSLIRIYIQLLMKTPTLASICDRSYISYMYSHLRRGPVLFWVAMYIGAYRPAQCI